MCIFVKINDLSLFSLMSIYGSTQILTVPCARDSPCTTVPYYTHSDHAEAPQGVPNPLLDQGVRLEGQRLGRPAACSSPRIRDRFLWGSWAFRPLWSRTLKSNWIIKVQVFSEKTVFFLSTYFLRKGPVSFLDKLYFQIKVSFFI